MRIGPYRQRLVVQRLVETTDAYGQRVQSWQVAGTFWALVTQSAGAEAVNAKQVRANVTHEISLRCVGTLFLPGGIDPTMRLVMTNPPYRAQIFNIIEVNNVDNRNREYKIMAQELVTPAPAVVPSGGPA